MKGGEWVYMGVGEAPDSSRWERSPAMWYCVRAPRTSAVAPRTSVGAFKVGQRTTGRVSRIDPFAIYVDIGCTNNGKLVAPPHISEQLEIGDDIRGIIVDKVDEATDCIELSTEVLSIGAASAAPAPDLSEPPLDQPSYAPPTVV